MAEQANNNIPVDVTIRKSPDQFYRTFLNLLIAASGQKLTDTEKDILEDCFLHAKGQFTSEARKEIAERLNMSVGNLNNYIKKLRDKKYIGDGDRLVSHLNAQIFKSENAADTIRLGFILKSNV